MPDKPILFCFGLHNHQPVGNFDHVFEEAYQKAYLPFLETFAPHRSLKVTQHFTGILLDWFLDHHPDFVDRIGGLVDSGRVELLGGGYYEPILPMLPAADRQGQILALSDRIESLFGKRPRGAWIAERVWEPSLPKTLADCGLEFVLLDDSHFRIAGIQKEKLLGPFRTEDEGRVISVFPIDETLRYTIPFRQVHETLNYLREFPRLVNGISCAVVADDGEKFGVWPETYGSVYGEGWLESFFGALAQENGWIESVTLSEALDRSVSQGLVYLPTASYSEMMDWALPPDEGQAIENFRNEIGWETSNRYARFIKGGLWRSFLSKYREIQHLHRKMLSVSEAVAALPQDDPATVQVRNHLWAAQCNCGYWHGVFGGIYLNHIRAANYHNLIEAEDNARKLLPSAGESYLSRTWDFFRDGGGCLEVTTPTESLLFDLSSGGALVEWDDLRTNNNLVNTMSRQPEKYHNQWEENGTDNEHAENHPLDPYRRVGNIHHFFLLGLDLDTFMRSPGCERTSFPSRAARGTFQRTANGCEIGLHCSGTVVGEERTQDLHVTQSWIQSRDESGWRVATTVKNTGAETWTGYYGLEFGWSLNAGDTPDRYYLINGEKPRSHKLASVGATEGVSRLELVEEWWGIGIQFTFDDPVRLWRFPIETVSRSVGGLEKTYQSSVVIPCWPAKLEPDIGFTVRFSLEVKSIR